jgi:hypothetical protein
MSMSARHEAELKDGRRLLLLGDRGWTERVSGPADVRSLEISVEEIETAARTVVGPDEPFDGRSREELEADHWAFLAGVLRQHGVTAEALELKKLPHDVVLGQRLLVRIGRDRDDSQLA